jgi:hypothetical protein
MTIPQLKPLLELVTGIEAYPDASDIAAEIKQLIVRAATPSMAQNVCEHIITMCHPKAWGDRYVSGMSTNDWFRFLSNLSDLAAKCGQGIYDANRPIGA